MGCMQGRDSDPYAKPDAEISAPHRLLVEGASSPLGVGRDVPRLSWRSAVDRQHAYEIEVASAQNAVWRVRVWQEGEARPGEWSETGVWQMGLLNQSDWKASWITSPIFPPAPRAPGLETWLKAAAADPHFKDAEKVADTVKRLRDVRPATYFRKEFTVEKPIKSAR